MASLLRHTECPACGHRHHFSLPTEDLMPGREYAYVCPETGKKATLRPTAPAEIVHSPTQGAVALTPAMYDSPADPGHPPSQAPHEPAHPQAVDPGELPEEALARVSPFRPTAPVAPGLPRVEREMHEIGQEVQDLAARVGELEEKVATTPAWVTPPAAPPAGANEPEAGLTRLQEVLPEVKDLAGKVGGLEKLSDIVQTLKETKE